MCGARAGARARALVAGASPFKRPLSARTREALATSADSPRGGLARRTRARARRTRARVSDAASERGVARAMSALASGRAVNRSARAAVLLGEDADGTRASASGTGRSGTVPSEGASEGVIRTTARAIGIMIIAVAVVALIVYASTRLEIDLYEDVVPHVRNPVKFFLLNIAVATFGVIPGAASATCVTAGILFGTLGGMALCVSSASIGAAVSFTLSRYFARPWVEKTFVRDGGRFKALDEAVSKDGSQIVMLVRLSPFSPFTVASYVLGLTSVPFVSYALATLVGLFPSSFVYVYIGDTGRRASGADGATAIEIIFYVVGLLLTLFVSYRLAIIAQDTMRKKVGTDWDPSTGEEENMELDVFGSPIDDDDGDENDDDEIPLVASGTVGVGREGSAQLSKNVI